MNQAQKIIWSMYLGIWIYIFFLVDEYSRDSYIFGYLILGWIPFLIAHFIWKDKSSKPKTKEQLERIKKIRKSIITIIIGFSLWLLSKLIGGAVFEIAGLIAFVIGLIDLIKNLRRKNTTAS